MAHTFYRVASGRIERRPVTSATRRRYAALLERLPHAFASMPVDAIRPEHVEDCLRAAALAPSTSRLLLSFVRSVLAEAGNTAGQAVRLRVPDTDHVTLGRDATERLRAALEAAATPAADIAIVVLETGLRIGEALALCPHDFDPATRTLTVRRSKTRRARSVDTTEYLAARLEARGLPAGVGERAVRRAVVRACKAAGLPVVRVHDLRHSRATRLILAGVPVLYVSNQLGHSSVAFTLRLYGHLAVATGANRLEWANA